MTRKQEVEIKRVKKLLKVATMYNKPSTIRLYQDMLRSLGALVLAVVIAFPAFAIDDAWEQVADRASMEEVDGSDDSYASAVFAATASLRGVVDDEKLDFIEDFVCYHPYWTHEHLLREWEDRK